MPILVLKLFLAPVLVTVASLITRRYGPRVGGWLVSLPLVSGPVLLVLALDQGTAFAASAAVGAISGIAGNAGFGVAYAYAGRGGWRPGILVATLAFFVVGLAFRPGLGGPPWLIALLVVAVITIALLVLPTRTDARVRVTYPAWDLPARIVAATALVFTLTTLAPLLGPELSGMLAAYPVYATVMTTFTHHRLGLPAAVELSRGQLTGNYGTLAFFLGLIALLVPAGIAPAMLVAIAAALVSQALAFRISPGRPAALQPAARPARPSPN
jgi:hypothetical protein